jgi:hypothetical protein
MEEKDKQILQMLSLTFDFTKILVDNTGDRDLLQEIMTKNLGSLERVLNCGGGDEYFNPVYKRYLLIRDRMTQLGMGVEKYDEYVRELMLTREKVNSGEQN